MGNNAGSIHSSEDIDSVPRFEDVESPSHVEDIENISNSEDVEKSILDEPKEVEVKKVLLLGAGDTGKSTLFKQAKANLGNGYSKEERLNARNAIYKNVIVSVRQLAFYAIKYRVPITANEEVITRLGEPMESGFGILLTLTDFQNYKHDMVTAWENKAIQHMYCNSHLIVDNFPREALRHYMQKIDDICKESYIPTIQDLYYSKLKTVGIIEIRVQLKNIAINLFDTGGQRNERKSKSFYNFNTLEWVHHFENASCVVFTASLSDWATLCYEDDRTNRTIESLNLFEELVNKEGLIDADVPFVLILGKADSLPHISKQVPFNSIFPAYTGDNLDCAGIAKFISDKYVSKYKGPLKNKILPLVISGIDTDIVAQAITILEDVIVNRNTAGHEFKMLYKFDAFSLFKTTPITLCDIDIFCQKRVRQGRMRSNGIRRRN